MSPIVKRKVDGNENKDEGIPSKRFKHTPSTLIESEPAKEPSPRSSPEPSPATGSTSAVEAEANDHASKSFQDLGIIQSLCDACIALGYKVCTSL